MPTSKSAAKKAASSRSSGAQAFQDRICNLVPSVGTDQDFTITDAVAVGAVARAPKLPASVDLRAGWWAINDQENTGSCVGWATADGVVRRNDMVAPVVHQYRIARAQGALQDEQHLGFRNRTSRGKADGSLHPRID